MVLQFVNGRIRGRMGIYSPIKYKKNPRKEQIEPYIAMFASTVVES